VWLKVPEVDFAFEGRVLELLRPLAPEVLPTVLAYEPEHGWLVLADHGDEPGEVDWPPVLRRYAQLQRDATPLADALVAAGADDYRGTLLGERVAELVPGNARAQELCARLAESVISPTAEHCDLRVAHVRGTRILDWGDMCVAHPFLSVCYGDPWRNRDAYIEGWPADDGALESAHELRALWGALNWSRVVRYDAARAADVRDLIARF
jgi:hypothetical protein